MSLEIARNLYKISLETITDDLDDKHSQIVRLHLGFAEHAS